MAFFDDMKDVIHEAKSLFPEENAENKNRDDNDTKTVFLKCPYCGTQNKIIWREGALPRCPYCGGEYNVSQAEEQRKPVAEPGVPWHKKFRIHIILVAMLLIISIFAAIYLALGGGPMSMRMDSNFEIHIGETTQP